MSFDNGFVYRVFFTKKGHSPDTVENVGGTTSGFFLTLYKFDDLEKSAEVRLVAVHQKIT